METKTMEIRKCTFVWFDPSDFLGHSRDELSCSDCIKGFCPSRTVAFDGQSSFILCGAKKLCAPVLDAYRARTGDALEIARPE